MIENGVLWVPHPALMLEKIGGLTVLERQLWTASRAGFKRLWVEAEQPSGDILRRLRLPAGLELRWRGQKGAEPTPPYMGISADHFIRTDALGRALGDCGLSAVSWLDEEGACVLESTPSRLDQIAAALRKNLPKGSCLRLEKPINQGPARDWLLEAGPKASDGFMARHFDRSISLSVSRLLLETPVTPNMMTAFSCFIGLCGALFFLKHDWTSTMIGAVLVWLHSVLDGCDGELARIHFQESPLGAAVDFWGDNLVHLALFSCMAWGFYRADNSLIPLVLGAAAAAGTLGSAILAYKQKLQGRGPVGGCGRPEGALARLETILAQRDFIYLLLALAYFGRTYEFLWAAAVGSLLFFAMMSVSAQRGAQEVVT